MNSAPPLDQLPIVRPVRAGDEKEWLRMRTVLWPHGSRGDHADEISAFIHNHLATWLRAALAVQVFVAERGAERLCGFVEASVRACVEDCDTHPVGYVEGWFVDPDMRRQGVGRALVAAAEHWAATQGCHEMASDAAITNQISIPAQKALGFEESSRAVHFRKWISGGDRDTPAPSFAIGPLHLILMPGQFTVCRLDAHAPIPSWATEDGFFSITHTADELSIVCREGIGPDDVQCERGWRCLRVAGPIPFTAVGVLASLTAPLAEARVGVFALSTFDTDYLLIKERDLPAAIDALRRRGHTVDSASYPASSM
jgi:GNAT superfamily N-acetyltransferase